MDRPAAPSHPEPPLRWTLQPTRLGLLAVAGGAKGLRLVQFGTDAGAIRRQLARWLPATPPLPAGADALLDAAVAAIDAWPTAGAPPAPLPLDLRGSDFQLRVWRALLEIPWGAVRSYAEVAAAIGMPKAVRAVAGACAANRVAVLVPCHRVRRSDGGLGGYRWGLDGKRALLAAEAGAYTGGLPFPQIPQGPWPPRPTPPRWRSAISARPTTTGPKP
ncbi:MAG: methylated-DNA--[protein]-cysteine S-methyltransferase [Xanthomonadaceae bacterium]|jgi:AraC family transcriptional regulator of adaptative response/methylated-DNA-[protein]-cysteine methyltransferase|nr:methylated-DNA--[protein]-cysteine S-methyltransferase [Xanthomonadaceae bacterium]